MLNKFVLHKSAARDASTESAPASLLPPDRGRQLRLQVRLWWERFRHFSRRAPRRLRLCESLPLGESRFVAVVEFERTRFLVGGTASSLVLLAHLGNGQTQVKDAKQEQEEDQNQEHDQFPDRNEKKDTRKDGTTATDPAATKVSGSVQS